MDLALVARVLWRFRFVVLGGAVLAVCLAALAMFKVGFDGGKPSFTYREAEVWRTDATLFVTQDGFPWGRIRVGEAELDPNDSGAQFGDPGRFSDLAIVYSELAASDAVRGIMRKDGPINGAIQAEPLTSDDGDGLPLVGLSALSDTPESSLTLIRRQIKAFSQYIVDEQSRNGIPQNDRVKVQALAEPKDAVLELARKKTRPLAIFMAVMLMTVGLAFALENLRPQPSSQDDFAGCRPTTSATACSRSPQSAYADLPARRSV